MCADAVAIHQIEPGAMAGAHHGAPIDAAWKQACGGMRTPVVQRMDTVTGPHDQDVPAAGKGLVRTTFHNGFDGADVIFAC